MTTVTSTSTAAGNALKFSIVIPTYNEAGGIERLIVSLNEVFAAHHLDGEIIVVDDNSPDGTGAIVDRLATMYPVRRLRVCFMVSSADRKVVRFVRKAVQK